MEEVDILKLEGLAYWRFRRQHIIGAIECGNADIKTMTKARMLTETEVKISIADMQCEIKTKRTKHWYMRLNRESYNDRAVHYFYFLVPLRLKDKAIEVCSKKYPYAGLLVLDGEVKDLYHNNCIQVIKSAKRLKRVKATEADIIRLGYAACNTAIKYGNKLLTQTK